MRTEITPPMNSPVVISIMLAQILSLSSSCFSTILFITVITPQAAIILNMPIEIGENFPEITLPIINNQKYRGGLSAYGSPKL